MACAMMNMGPCLSRPLCCCRLMRSAAGVSSQRVPNRAWPALLSFSHISPWTMAPVSLPLNNHASDDRL
jgi:hypothetical protein